MKKSCVSFVRRPRCVFAKGVLLTAILSHANMFAVPVNLAPGGTATASSAGWGSVASDAIDGNRDPEFNNGSVWHTTDSWESHWFEVDLGADYYLDRVLIFPRNFGPHWTDFHIIVRDSSSSVVYSNNFLAVNNLDSNWGSSNMRGVRGRTVRIQSNGAPKNASMAEFEVWGQLEPSLNNFALKAAVTGTPGGYGATLNDIRDGDIDGDFYNSGYPVYHSNSSGTGKVVRIDFGSSIHIDHLHFYNRSDSVTGARLKIDVLDDSASPIYTVTNDLAGTDLNARRYNVTLAPDISGRYVKLATLDSDFIEMAEVEVMSTTSLPAIQPADILIQPDPVVNGVVRDNHTGQIACLFRIPAGTEGYVVRALGFYDHNGDGLSQSHKVGVWYTENNGATGSLICEVTVPEGTDAPLYHGCRWVNLETPTTLSTQTIATAWYVLGAAIQSGSGDHFVQSVVGGGWHYNPALQEGYTDRRWTLSGWDAFPSSSGGSGIYHAANLSVEAIPVESPVFTGTLILIQ